MKTRISMTISRDLLKKLDLLVDGIQTRSRSEAIEYIVAKYLDTNNIAVFLGGGNPEKLKIDGIYRPLVKIKDKYLIEYSIIQLKKAGFRKIYIIGHNQLIGDLFKALGNGDRYNIDITYIEEKKAQGNAKTLQLAESYIHTRFLVLPVDTYFDFDLSDLVRKHILHNSLATVAVQATRENLSDLGVVEMQGERIVGYEERPKSPKTFLASTSIGVYEPQIFSYIPRGDIHWIMQTDIFPQLIKNNALYGYIISGPRFNVHKTEDISRIAKVLQQNSSII